MHLAELPFSYIVLVIAAVVIWLLLREVNCWYWKINERLALLEEIVARLERLERLESPENSRLAAPPRETFPEINID